MPNTGKGLPYPVATDPVALGASNIQALAEAVDPQLGSAYLEAAKYAATNVGGSQIVLPVDTITHENDPRNKLSLAGDGIKVDEAGYYLLSARATFPANPTGSRVLIVSTDGGEMIRAVWLAALATGVLGASTVAAVGAGAIVTFALYQDSGATLAISNTTLAVVQLGR